MSRMWLSLIALILGTTGGAWSATPATGPAANALYEPAKKEGTVTIWATNAEDLDWIPPAFNRTYPDIKVQVFTDLNVAARVITESRAGRHDADVVWNSEALVEPLIERQLLVRGGWEKWGIPARDVGADGHMVITSSVAFAVAYRKDLVAANDVPRRWEDVAAARYRGRMAASPILFARLCAALAAWDGEQKLLDFARQIRTDSQTLWNNDLLEKVIVSGERPFVVGTANYLADRWKQRGLPVEVVLPEPVFVTQFGAVVMQRAPHPNAARLLAAWLGGTEGKAAREKALLAVDLRPESVHPQAVALRKSGKKIYVDNRQAMTIRTRLIPEMDRIISGLN